MWLIAWKMLIGDRAKYIGIVIGLTFAALIMTQQSAIFLGIMRRTYGFIEDTGLPDIWVVDNRVEFVDDVKPVGDTMLLRVREVPGVQWAVPLFKSLVTARLQDGQYQQVILIGLDDATLIGGPPRMVQGSLEYLRVPDSFIVNAIGAKDRLSFQPWGAAAPRPFEPGDVLEINDNRAICVGICATTRTFQSQAIMYTTYTRAIRWAPPVRRTLSFILVKARAGENIEALCQAIESSTGMQALSQKGFENMTVMYFIRKTGIAVNFGVAVLLGFIIGTIIAGQTFYNFTLDNLRYLGTLKAMGCGNSVLIRMVLLQAFAVGGIGYGIGVGAAALFGVLVSATELSFRLPWYLPVLTLVAILVISLLSSLLSLTKVMRLEPAIVFRS
jgi:putative ABC transport system permease protein